MKFSRIHNVLAFAIGNTLTETWRGVHVIRSYSSTDKSNFFCVFDYILHVPELTAFSVILGLLR